MNIYSWLRPPRLNDPDNNRAAILLYGLLWFTITAFALLVVSTLLIEPENIRRALRAALIVITLSALSLGILSRGNLIRASALFVFQLWLVVTISGITGGGMATPAIQGYLLVILAAGLLIGWRWGMLTGLICTATEFAITYAEITGVLPPYQDVRTPLTYFIVYTLISGLVVIFVYYYTSSIKTALDLAKKEIAERERAEKEIDRAQHQLTERIKELTVLQQTAQILQTDDDAPLDVLQKIASLLPSGWHNPERAEARITFDGSEFTTPDFKATPWIQRADFRTSDGKAGAVELAYQEVNSSQAGAQFFPEEHNLIRTLAEMLKTYLERWQAEQHVQRQLEHMSSLHTIDSAILTSTDLRITLEIVIQQVLSRLKADAAAFLLLNPHLARLEFAVGTGFRTSDYQRDSQGIGSGFAGMVAMRRQLVHLPNIPRESVTSALATVFKAEDFVSYVGVPLIAKGEVMGVLEVFHRSPIRLESEWFEFLTSLAGQSAIAVNSIGLFQELNRRNIELAVAYDITLEGWSKALDLRDKETEGHSRRVTEMTVRLAQRMGLSDKELGSIRQGALLHDVGKLGIPDSILLKSGPLNDQELEIMRKHPTYAHEWLSPIAYLRPAIDIPYCHHERWDGSGYPRGLAGEVIPLAARLFAVVDVYDALTSDRPYRKSWSRVKVIGHIREQSGKHFDPKAVNAFLRMLDEEENMKSSRQR